MPEISPKAAVENPAGLAGDVRVGPFSYVGPEVTIAAGTVVGAHVTILGRTQIGGGCRLFPGCVVGAPAGGSAAPGRCTLAGNNTVRELVVIEAGEAQAGGGTVLGPNNLLMVGCQVGHDAALDGEGIFANLTRIEPHALIEKFVRTSGFTVVQSYATVGAYAFTTGYAGVEQDAPPYAIVHGLPSAVRGINVQNLRRCGFDAGTVAVLKDVFRMLFDGRAGFPGPERLRQAEQTSDNEHVKYLIDSLRRSAASPTGRRLEPAEPPG